MKACTYPDARIIGQGHVTRQVCLIIDVEDATLIGQPLKLLNQRTSMAKSMKNAD